jgi:hypothetical protein
MLIVEPERALQLEVCYSLFFESYHFASESVGDPPQPEVAQEKITRIAELV